MEQNKKFRNFCWTDFICDNNFYIKMKEKNWKYFICGEEFCPETQKKHLQCFGVSKSPRTIKSLIKELAPRHVEVCKGSPGENMDYCQKGGEWEEWGERPQRQGKRGDIDVVRECVKDGGNMRDVVEVASSYQSIRVAEKYFEYREKRRSWKPVVEWYFGGTGTGKTRSAVEKCVEAVGDDGYWISDSSLKWWQGYDGHTHIIFDDFRGDYCKFHELLRILDRYPYRIECKGGARQLLATHIYITSPFSPFDVYKKNEEDVEQLIRRIDTIKDFGGR